MADNADGPGDDLKLTADEIRTLKLMAKYWGGINTVSQIAANLGSVGKWLMYAYAVYVAIKLGVLDRYLIGGDK